jgi:hypothetical protein
MAELHCQYVILARPFSPTHLAARTLPRYLALRHDRTRGDIFGRALRRAAIALRALDWPELSLYDQERASQTRRGLVWPDRFAAWRRLARGTHYIVSGGATWHRLGDLDSLRSGFNRRVWRVDRTMAGQTTRRGLFVGWGGRHLWRFRGDGVTVLSTLAMIAYPFALKWLEASPQQAGLFLGGTIHDVAQVVAAGMMLGPEAGDTATVVKLFRVMLLTPVVVVIALLYRRQMAQATADAAAAVAADGKATTQTPASVPLIPGFLLAFIVLMLLASTQVFPKAWVDAASNASRWCLVAAIAAAGVKTSFEELLKLGWQPVIMLIAETLFIAALVAAGLWWMR